MMNTDKAIRRVSVKFSVDRLGRPVAYRWSMLAARWFRIGYDEAKVLVATGRAIETYRKVA